MRTRDVASAENMNWMQALRFVAAKDIRKRLLFTRIHCRQENMTLRWKSTVWSDYKNEKLTDAISCATWYVSRWWMWQQVVGYLVAGEL